MFDERTILSQQVRENLRDFFGEKLYRSTIPRNVRLAEAPSHGQPAVVYDPRSRGAVAYRELTQEFLRQNGFSTSRGGSQTRQLPPTLPTSDSVKSMDPEKAPVKPASNVRRS